MISTAVDNEILNTGARPSVALPCNVIEPEFISVRRIASQVTKAAKPRNLFQKRAMKTAAIAAIQSIAVRL